MIKLKQITKTFGDCTAGYEVELSKQYTVNEFISDVLKRNEWGYIVIYDESQAWFNKGNPYCEYRNDKMVTEMNKEYLDRIIASVTAMGGWSNMDYKLKLE